MGAIIVVHTNPVVRQKPGLTSGLELPLIQAVILRDAIKAFVVGILAGLGELVLNAVFCAPAGLPAGESTEFASGQCVPHPTSSGRRL